MGGLARQVAYPRRGPVLLDSREFCGAHPVCHLGDGHWRAFELAWQHELLCLACSHLSVLVSMHCAKAQGNLEGVDQDQQQQQAWQAPTMSHP